MNNSFLGLILIICGWFSLLLNFNKNRGKVTQSFLILYMAGVIILIFDGVKNNLWDLVIGNFICLVIASLVVIKIKK
jgi:drug/metabolite transporter superfamily protein YnfA